MATILPGSPPTFNKNDISATVRALCNYSRTMHEQLDFLLNQLQKTTAQNSSDIATIKESVDSIKRTMSGMQGSIESLGSSYASLASRVAALEQKVN